MAPKILLPLDDRNTNRKPIICQVSNIKQNIAPFVAGVSHADDIMYILRSEAINTLETESDRQVSKELVNLWVSFAANKKLNTKEVTDSLPKIVFNDIQGPNKVVETIEEQLGEEEFWDSLNLLENVEKSETSRDEL